MVTADFSQQGWLRYVYLINVLGFASIVADNMKKYEGQFFVPEPEPAVDTVEVLP